jgi:outer membrane protein OmpA-like peptidoglycan-associated protein
MDKKKFRQRFTEGNLMILDQFYDTAITTFLYIRQMDTLHANVNYKIGYTYMLMPTQKKKAQRYLEIAAQHVSVKYLEDEPSEKNAPLITYFYLAQAFHINGVFQRAIDYYDKYKEAVGNRKPEQVKEIEHYKELCYNALELIKSPVKCEITNMGDSVNSVFPDYSPVITADEEYIYFTSRRPGMGGTANKTITGEYFEDIFMCTKRADGKWGKAKSIGATINTMENEATIGISPDGQQLFIYKDDNGDGNIYFSELNGDVWSSPEKLGEENKPATDINTKNWEPSACITSDGNIIYFVSDRKGGYGGRDLYRVVRLPNGYWSLAQNLGPTVNTTFDEDAPFIHPDGKTLFYSSKGQKSMGGFDIFYTVKTDEGFLPPQNVGYPINTVDDDIFYVLSADGKRAYYSSIRPDTKGEKDLYLIKLEQSLVDAVVLIKGKITFNGGDSLPPGINIRVKDMDTGEELPDVRPNPKTGKYVLILNPGERSRTYSISYEADSLQPIVEILKVEAKNAYTEIERPVDMKNINFESKTLGTMSVSGIIKNAEGKTLPATKITVYDNVTGKLLDTYYSNSETGLYYFIIERGKNYNIGYEADGYLFQSINVNVPKKPEFSEIKKDIVLEKIKVGVKVTLNNIFFDSGKSLLRKESNIELEKLLKVLKEHPEIKVEISGHTDNKGNDQLNLKLSQDRAQAVVNYLIKNGIKKTQLIAKGYGKTQPVAENNLPDGKPNPEGMQLNRRVDFKIVE